MKVIDYGIMAVVAVVILVIGVILLPSGPTQASLDSSYELACGELLQKGCDYTAIDSITALKDGNMVYTLGTVCAQMGYSDSASCAESCGCSVQENATSIDLVDLPVPVYSDNPVTVTSTDYGVTEDDYEEEVSDYYGI